MENTTSESIHDRIIETCLSESKEMIDFYKNHHLSDEQLKNLIIHAPLSLAVKSDLLPLTLNPDDEEIVKLKEEFDYIRRKLKRNLKLYKGKYDNEDQWFQFEDEFISLFDDLEDCLEYSKKDPESCYLIKKGKHRFVLLNGMIVYDLFHHFSQDLNLPIPYKPGEMIEIDCLPFYKKIPALIIWNDNDFDCCGCGVMYKEDSHYNLCALKHNHCCFYPILSPIYRLKRWKGVLPKEYEFLNVIKDEIKDMKKEYIEEYVRKRISL